MPFLRVWDSSCPQVYDQWESEGASWVIQDLLPEDDDKALELIADIMLNDETLTVALGLKEEEESVKGVTNYWRACIAQRMSLACYRTINGTRELVAANCCIVQCKGEDDVYPIYGERWNTIYRAMEYLESKADAFEYIGADKLLYAMGLVVRRDCRGQKLGARILQAREPLARSQGLKGSSTMFTGVASQKSAERAGFTEIARFTFSEVADIGLKFPRDDTKVIKLMVLTECFKIGLNVVATVCDLCSVNSKALHNLGASTETPWFNHVGREIVTIADPPHLLKCLRNMFMAHDIEFPAEIKPNGNIVKGTAKWDHIQQFYDSDKLNPHFVYAPALTDKHLKPNSKQKMRVKLAAQVFSHTVTAGILAKVATTKFTFKRVWDSKCPQVYDKWKSDGVSWVIQDLDPEDDDDALKLLMEIMLRDEMLCIAIEILTDKESIRVMEQYWRNCIAQRMSLGCYRTIGQKTELVAMNCCIVRCKHDSNDSPTVGKKWRMINKALNHFESKADAFESLKTDRILYAMGLVVRPHCRGAKLGARILAARKPLAISQGLKGSATVFTGPASQRSAEKAGFKEIARCTLAEFADLGLAFPRDESKVIKLMVKKYA